MVDHGRRLGIGVRDPQPPAGERLHRRHDEHHAAREQAVRVRCDREEVEVVRAGRPGRAKLAERLLLGRETRRGRLCHESAETLGAGELQLDERVVVEVPTDAGQIDHDADPGRPQVGRVSDPRALQDRR